MKVVIISQVCFPRLSPRGNRATELAKEFAKRGNDVTVYALLGDYDYAEFSQQTGVKFKSLGKSHFGLIDSAGNSSRNIFYRAFRRLFGKYFHFPYIELIPMIKNAILKEEEIDCLITIAGPYATHYAVAKSNRSKVKQWIADCGDPFMGNPFYTPPIYFEKFERFWCERCDYIMVPIKEAVAGYYPEYKPKIKVIPQGFDFNSVRLSEYVRNEVPTFAYAGAVYKDLRDPEVFLNYLSSLSIEFKFVVYTGTKRLFEKHKEILGDKIEIRNPVPRESLLFELSKMDFLLNISNDSGVQQPSKLIDYGLINRPILEVSSKFSSEERDNFGSFLNYDFSKKVIVENIQRYNIVNVVNNIKMLLKEKSEIHE